VAAFFFAAQGGTLALDYAAMGGPARDAPPPGDRHRAGHGVRHGHARDHPLLSRILEHLAARFAGGELTALDVGTGSGILAIALAKLGAASVVALDNDPTALKVARANVRVNGVGRRIRLANWKLDQVYGSFAVVVANLTAETIVDLAAAFEERVAAGGYLVLSGILQPKARQVVRRFCPATFLPVRQSREKEWVTLLLKKKS
jgi:ribosomal protein L11 methyltransferase